jgi:hypothetical protein
VACNQVLDDGLCHPTLQRFEDKGYQVGEEHWQPEDWVLPEEVGGGAPEGSYWGGLGDGGRVTGAGAKDKYGDSGCAGMTTLGGASCCDGGRTRLDWDDSIISEG